MQCVYHCNNRTECAISQFVATAVTLWSWTKLMCAPAQHCGVIGPPVVTVNGFVNYWYRRKLLLNWNRYLVIRRAMRRFVTFRTWSTWSRWSRKLWGCTLVCICSGGNLQKILHSVSEIFNAWSSRTVVYVHLKGYVCQHKLYQQLIVLEWIRTKSAS